MISQLVHSGLFLSGVVSGLLVAFVLVSLVNVVSDDISRESVGWVAFSILLSVSAVGLGSVYFVSLSKVHLLLAILFLGMIIVLKAREEVNMS